MRFSSNNSDRDLGQYDCQKGSRMGQVAENDLPPIPGPGRSNANSPTTNGSEAVGFFCVTDVVLVVGRVDAELAPVGHAIVSRNVRGLLG